MDDNEEAPANDDDDVVDLATRRARRPRRMPAVHAPAPVTPLLRGHRSGTPEAAIIVHLVQARLRQSSVPDDESRSRLAAEFQVYAHAVGVVLHPDDLNAAAGVRDRLLAAVRADVTDVESLLVIARDEPEPPEAS
ncbi:hypothetical protein ACFT2C_06175 [Promicromonospora sp. NPDC057138]|uniref:hypothetical protein n=1 Tax=Promicromonospora sp. NPDC057138 TaxID=3346031 RepID=UPI00362689EA